MAETYLRSVNYKEQIQSDNIPQHIAVIMDGNGRWAKSKGKFRIFGHRNGVKSVQEVIEAAAEIGVKYLTLYAFSTENWNRPKQEIDALMQLLVSTIRKETKKLMDNHIRLSTIGDTQSLPPRCRQELDEAMRVTSGNTRMTVILALSYSAKWDMVNAVKNIAAEVKNNKLDPSAINDKTINQFLSTNPFPHPEFLIRTSGEQRISNFLLWELAYSELYFTEKFWPDFRKEDFFEAIVNYQSRERRFGKTSEQVTSK